MAKVKISIIAALALFLFSGCSVTKRGLLNESTYYSTDSPNVKITLDDDFTHQPIDEDTSQYEFFTKDGTKGVVISQIKDNTPENIIDYYYPPLTWIFSGISKSEQISTGKTQILQTTWYFCDSIFHESGGCGLVRTLGLFTYWNDIFSIAYLQGLPSFLCRDWKNTSNLTSSQQLLLSSFHENFDNYIAIESYHPDKPIN